MAILEGQNLSLVCCWSRWPPVKNDDFYDVSGFQNAQKRYRFGTARRDHCAVPAWRCRMREKDPLPTPNQKWTWGKSKLSFFFSLAQLFPAWDPFSIHLKKWMFQLDGSKSLHGKWLLGTRWWLIVGLGPWDPIVKGIGIRIGGPGPRSYSPTTNAEKTSNEPWVVIK